MCYYITHKNIPVILLVNTTSRDIKYYAYIPNIWREGKKFLYKMDISLVLRDIVDILPISPMPTLIMWLPWRLLVLVFTDSDQKFWYKWYQIDMVSLEYCCDNADDANTNVLVTYFVTHSFLAVYRWYNAAKLIIMLGLVLDEPWQNRIRTRFHLNRHWKGLWVCWKLCQLQI